MPARSNSYIVAITPHSEINEGVVLIGANCTDASWGGISNGCRPLLISPYQNHADMERAADYCWEVALDICGHLSERLGSILGVRHNFTYWEALLLPWVLEWVVIMHDRYLRLDWVREHMPDAILELPQVSLPTALYQKAEDTCRYAHLHSINAALYTLIIQSMGLQKNVRILEASIKKADLEHKIPVRQRAKDFIRQYGGFLLRRVRPHKPSPFEQLGIGVAEFAPGSIRDLGFALQKLDRNVLCLELHQDEFRNILGRLIGKALPTSLFEEYCGRSSYANHLIKERKIQAVSISNTFWSNDSIKYVLAALREANALVLGRQHGAGYGSSEISLTEQTERYLSDVYVTWGWTDGRHGETLPLPDPRLSGLSDRHEQVNRDILFLGNHSGMYMFQFLGNWMPEFVYEHYGRMQGVFLDALGDPVKARIVYRLYHHEYGWKERERLRRFLPGIRFDSAGRAVESMSCCALVVIDHMGTSFLEALVMNTPVVAYWSPEQNLMRYEARSYFKLLKDAGIIFDDPESAAQQVNAVADDPHAWWSGGAIQAARKEFCRRFAWAEPDWEAHWRDAFGGDRLWQSDLRGVGAGRGNRSVGCGADEVK